MMFKRVLTSTMVVSGVVKSMTVPGLDDADRYNQLLSVMQMANENFSADQYWAYGCNCHMAHADPVRGQPKDELDASCKRYKDCLKCVAMDHGDTCVNTYYKYKIRDQNKGISCKDGESSCERALCECDKMFAEAHAAAANSYDETYHIFDGGFVPEDECPGPSNGPSNGSGDLQCCGVDGSPKMLYNANSNKKCCSDGTVKTECGGGGGGTGY